VKLRYTLPALADLDAVLNYITARSPQGARRVQARIQAIIDLLLLYPGIGSRTDDPAIRRMTARPYPYVIFYEATRARSSSTPSVTRRGILLACRVRAHKHPDTADAALSTAGR
jgi:plasmid stabilization system protein ParE